MAAKKAAAKKAAAPARAARARKSPVPPSAGENAPTGAAAPVGAIPPRPIWEGGGETRQQYHARVHEWKLARREALEG